MEYRKDGLIFKAPSRRKNKKYDVFNALGDYIVSFGDIRHGQFKDKIGYYKEMNNNSLERRRLYHLRHNNDDINDKTKAGYYSYNYLW